MQYGELPALQKELAHKDTKVFSIPHHLTPKPPLRRVKGSVVPA